MSVATETREELVETVRRFVEREVLPIAGELEHRNEYPYALVERMKDLGLFGATIPAEFGGLGLDVTTYAMVVEELGKGWMSLTGVLNTHLMLAFMLSKQYRRPEAALPSLNGSQRRSRRRVPDRAARRQRSAADPHRSGAPGRSVRPERQQDVHHQRPFRDLVWDCRENRPERGSAAPRHEPVHWGEGSRTHRRPRSREARLQGNRDLRGPPGGLPGRGRQPDRRAGGTRFPPRHERPRGWPSTSPRVPWASPQPPSTRRSDMRSSAPRSASRSPSIRRFS